ncbi:ubiquitin carboxyl-terminal hydrolase 16 isoform X1 [Labeo rohita]|uniref:Ubiquitin carboxyl-terminal hydrolase 16 isoform X1 n=1 Tax=Labeo rohita TaxID=84645 RepID=A0A498M0E4_LABRO|nr:ubiquitin carboxyl-terminal hydrolase 16 isoform X1 [Labeo rohita]RXN13082.1 ubiquitin carboxyl-terminal hydrolase 16 isoform X1 [Labeo rohita]
MWMCLKFGQRGYGRSENQHAIKHYEMSQSEPHCLVLSLDDWSSDVTSVMMKFSIQGRGKKKQVLTDPGKKNSNRKKKKEESLVINPAEQMLYEEKEIKEKQNGSSKHDDSPKRQKAVAAGSSGVCIRGLNNLGNTCFFNAVM